MAELRPARLDDQRITSGSWRVHERFSQPAGLDRQSGRRHSDPLGGCFAAIPGTRVQGRETYGSLPGANLLDWPVSLKEMEPYYAKAENQMGVTRTNDIPGLPGNNNYKVLEAGAKKLATKTCSPGAWRSTASRVMAGAPASRSASASRAANPVPNGRRSIPRSPRAKRPAIWKSGPTAKSSTIEHNATGNVTGVSTPTRTQMQRQKARVWRSPAIRLNAPAAAQFRIQPVSGRACQFIRPGRPQLHAPHHRLGLRHLRQAVHMYRGTTMAGIVRDEARHDTKPWLCRRL